MQLAEMKMFVFSLPRSHSPKVSSQGPGPWRPSQPPAVPLCEPHSLCSPRGPACCSLRGKLAPATGPWHLLSAGSALPQRHFCPVRLSLTLWPHAMSPAGRFAPQGQARRSCWPPGPQSQERAGPAGSTRLRMTGRTRRWTEAAIVVCSRPCASCFRRFYVSLGSRAGGGGERGTGLFSRVLRVLLSL